MSDTTTSTGFQLVLPADPQLLRVVRLVASGLASLGQLDLDTVEEIRVAADELVSTLIEASSNGSIALDLQLSTDAVRMTGTTGIAAGTEVQIDPITDRILSTVATSHSWTVADGELTASVERALG